MKLVQIKTFFLAAGAFMTVVLFSKCSKDDEALPPINGYNSSDDVASASLLAKWGFDGSPNETKSTAAPVVNTGSSYVAGVKGQALDLSGAGFLLYPSIPALNTANAIPSVTVSVWVKTSNNGTGATSVFALTKSLLAQSDWNDGPLNVYLENGKPTAYDDTLVLHSMFGTFSTGSRQNGDNINDYGDRGVDFQTVLGAKKWVHYVMRYEASTSFIDLFANGVRVSNNKFRFREVGGVGLGAIEIPTPTQVVIGAWPNATAGYINSPAQSWQSLYKGSIDELRVYNKNLSDLEIGSIYQLELAGR